MTHFLSQVCTFVENWSDPLITPDTFRIYGKKSPAIEAAKMYINQVKRTMNSNDYRERIAEDVQIPQHSRQEWQQATVSNIEELDRLCKEPHRLLFFKKAIYEITYNDPTKKDKFSNSQLAVLFDIPSQEDLDRFKSIEVYVPPPGLKTVHFDQNMNKDQFIANGWKKVMIGIAPERTKYIKNHTQAQRRQYGLKHHFTATIHASMGETLGRVAVEISEDGLWDKAQVVVSTSRTKLGKETIFVGDKVNNLIISRYFFRNTLSLLY